MSTTETIKIKLVRDVEVPAKVDSHEEFSRVILMLRGFTRGAFSSREEESAFLSSMYYLLGWMVGDAGKGMGSRRRHTIRIRYALAKTHPENLELGNYVMRIIRGMGIWCERMGDRPAKRRLPHGSYAWDSHYSAIFGWMFTACLGLEWEERTTRTPVKMKWLLSAPREMRLQFLRGLADSDGGIHFSDKEVNIVTEPNSALVVALFQSLEIRSRLGTTHGFGMVIISGKNAAEIRIFNLEILTHRRKLLEKLVSAKTFQRHWPRWLQARAEDLLRQGLGNREVCEKLLEEDGVFVKYNTLKRKRAKLMLESRG